ncbi:MAG: 2-dehydro-3-deoxy-D-gluconate 5-dehydrogenase KduD [Chloroflexota bacterium]
MGILDTFRLDEKIALVTGANRGLGQAMAIGLADAGATVIGVSRSDSAEATATAIEATGQVYHHIQSDLSTLDADGCRQLIEQVIANHGQLDILVNNAGIIRRTPALDFSEGDWDDVLQVNLKVVFFLAQAIANHMREKGGKIINIASMLSYQGGITVPSYTASKHGIVGITRALANEWAQYGININAIAPGYMVTDNTAALRANPERNPEIVARIPAGAWGNPDDLQGAVVYLASDAARYVHGTILDVDGGWMAR